MQNSERIHAICDSLLNEILESDSSLLGRLESIGKNLSDLKQFQEGTFQLMWAAAWNGWTK